MSLKAKIEAVIYAAEEPVTLLQLAGLLGQEAQAELDQLAAAQQLLALESVSLTASTESDSPESSDPETLNSEVLGSLVTDDDEPAPPEYPSTPAFANPSGLDQPGPLTPEPTASSLPEGNVVDSAFETPDPIGETLETAGQRDTAPSQPAVPMDEKQMAREARSREARLRDYFRHLLDDLVREYSTSDRGLEIREVAGGYRLATKPEYHDAVRGFVKRLKPPLKLSLQALETLAVVAYKQPVTAPEVSEIRGVDSGGVLGSLMTRKLVTTAGRKQVIGRPILYKTTKDFLLRFGLKDINELPSIEEFERMAGELVDQDSIPEQISIQEQAPMNETTPNYSAESTSITTPESITGANLEQERDATEPQADGDPADISVAEDAVVDGRLSGVPPGYDTDPESNTDVDSPAKDAEIQGQLGSDR